MYPFQKLLGALLMPSVMASVASIVGILLLWTTRHTRKGRVLVSSAGAVFLLLGWGIPSSAVVRHLESRFPPVLERNAALGIKWIVVLGGGYRAGARLSVTSRPSESTIYRVAEGVRLHMLWPESRLLFTGATAAADVSVASVGRDLALALGVAPTAIVVAEEPRTTAEEAAAIRRLVGEDAFLVVTSAVHMPRAMYLLHCEGLTPIAAPTQHHATGPSASLWRRALPRPENIVNADAAAHEVLGLVWARIGRGAACDMRS